MTPAKRSIYDQATTAIQAEHRVEVGEHGWGCSCGAGRDWPLAPVGRARAASDRHLQAQQKAIIERLRQEVSQ